jgi:hypothetical protein
MKLFTAIMRNVFATFVLLLFIIPNSALGQPPVYLELFGTPSPVDNATNSSLFVCNVPAWGEKSAGLSLRCRFEKEQFGLWEPIYAVLEVKIDKAVFQGKFSTKYISLCSHGKDDYYCNFGQEDYRQVILLSDNDNESMYRIWFNCKYDFGFVPPLNQICNVSFAYVIAKKDSQDGIFAKSNSVRISVPLERELEKEFYISELLRNSESQRPARDLCEWFCLCYPVSNLKEFGTDAQIELEKRFYEEKEQKDKEILLRAILCFEKEPRKKLKDMQAKTDGETKAIITWILNQYD